MTEALFVVLISYCLLGFGGCMKDVKFTRGAVVNLASVSSSAVRVNLDGCLSTDSAVNCRGNDSILVYRGKEQSVYESALQPFTGSALVPYIKCIIFIPFFTNVLLCSVFFCNLLPPLSFFMSCEEYLYRVVALNEGGSVSSAWTHARTRESGK